MYSPETWDISVCTCQGNLSVPASAGPNSMPVNPSNSQTECYGMGKLKILFGVQEARHNKSHSIRLLKISRLGKSVEKDRRVWAARTQRVAVGNDSLSCCYNMALKMSSFTRESLITHGSGSFYQVVMSGEELLTEG